MPRLLGLMTELVRNPPNEVTRPRRASTTQLLLGLFVFILVIVFMIIIV